MRDICSYNSAVGKYVTHLGLQHLNLEPCRPRGIPLSETTIAEELRPLGYRSHLIGIYRNLKTLSVLMWIINCQYITKSISGTLCKNSTY